MPPEWGGRSLRTGADGPVRTPGGSRIPARPASKRFSGRGAPEGHRCTCALRAPGSPGHSASWRVDATTGREVLRRDDGLRRRMADRLPARLQGYGPAAAALGAPPGGGLLCRRSAPLRSAPALPAVAADDQGHPGFRGARLAAMVGEAATMRFELMWPWVLLLAVALAVAWHLVRRHRARVAERRGRPAGLRDAELICVESQFRSKSRWPIVARVDRAYRLPNGLVVLVELKTRSTAAVRASDVIQLSAQRVAVEDELRVQVSDEAFVIFRGRHSAPPTARAVRLMSREQVESIGARRRRLIDGLDHPRWPDSEHVCHGCGQRAACSAAGERLADMVRRR